MKLHELNKFLSPLNLIIARNYPRHSIRKAKELFGKKPIKVLEIGTFEGDNALSIFKELNVEKFYIIDPYKGDEEYLSREVKRMRGVLKAENIARKKLDKFKDRIVWIKDYSDNAVNKIQENINFICIDGNHEYSQVKKDIENYYPKVKKGGILAGHDICHHIFNKNVFRALADFSVKKKLFPEITRTDWWIIKK